MVEDRIIEAVPGGNTYYLVIIESGKSKNQYWMDVVWNPELDKWEAMGCNCKGYENRSTCRHVRELFKTLVLPKPSIVKEPELKEDYWMYCDVCEGKEFYIHPFIQGDDKKIVANSRFVTCCRCGRRYELI